MYCVASWKEGAKGGGRKRDAKKRRERAGERGSDGGAIKKRKGQQGGEGERRQGRGERGAASCPIKDGKRRVKIDREG